MVNYKMYCVKDSILLKSRVMFPSQKRKNSKIKLLFFFCFKSKWEILRKPNPVTFNDYITIHGNIVIEVKFTWY